MSPLVSYSTVPSALKIHSSLYAQGRSVAAVAPMAHQVWLPSTGPAGEVFHHSGTGRHKVTVDHYLGGIHGHSALVKDKVLDGVGASARDLYSSFGSLGKSAA